MAIGLDNACAPLPPVFPVWRPPISYSWSKLLLLYSSLLVLTVAVLSRPDQLDSCSDL